MIIVLLMCVPFVLWPVLYIREALAAQARERSRERMHTTDVELLPCIRRAAAHGGSGRAATGVSSQREETHPVGLDRMDYLKDW